MGEGNSPKQTFALFYILFINMHYFYNLKEKIASSLTHPSRSVSYNPFLDFLTSSQSNCPEFPQWNSFYCDNLCFIVFSNVIYMFSLYISGSYHFVFFKMNSFLIHAKTLSLSLMYKSSILFLEYLQRIYRLCCWLALIKWVSDVYFLNV